MVGVARAGSGRRLAVRLADGVLLSSCLTFDLHGEERGGNSGEGGQEENLLDPRCPSVDISSSYYYYYYH